MVKLTLFILAVGFVGIFSTSVHAGKSAHELCLEESGATEDEVKDVTTYPEDSGKLACYGKCLGVLKGDLKEDGTLDLERADADPLEKGPDGAPKFTIDEIYEKCKPITGENACETGAKVANCIASVANSRKAD